MSELIQLAKDFQGLGVAGVMALLGYVMIRHLKAEADRERQERATLVAELRATQQDRLADQVKWADRFEQSSVRAEATAQKLTASLSEQAEAFQRLTDRLPR